MKRYAIPTLNIALKIEVNTEETCSRMVQAVIEILLFQRSQIPFCYDVFKSIVRKISGHTRESAKLSEWKNYQLSKKQTIAQKTTENIEILFKQLSVAVQKGIPDAQFMILFGSTVYTAKEAFVLNVPKINRNHYPQYHRHSIETILKQLTMRITVAEELHDDPKVTGPTNTFLLIGHDSDYSEELLMGEDDTWQLMDEYRLPLNCKKYVINLDIESANTTNLHCCKEMQIFNDVEDLTIEQMGTSLHEKNKTVGYQSGELGKVWFQIGNSLKGLKMI